MRKQRLLLVLGPKVFSQLFNGFGSYTSVHARIIRSNNIMMIRFGNNQASLVLHQFEYIFGINSLLIGSNCSIKGI